MISNIYAAGDCTSHHNFHYNRRMRLESVDNAFEQGASAALNMLGTPTRHDKLPWFWSDQYDLKLIIVGISIGYDQVVMRGDPASRSFSACYLRDGELVVHGHREQPEGSDGRAQTDRRSRTAGSHEARRPNRPPEGLLKHCGLRPHRTGNQRMHSIVIHGGAGPIPSQIPDAQKREYEASLGKALDAGYAILDRGGSSLDAVTLAVCMLEDDPLFNAGRGAALTRDGTAELDASIMDGRSQKAGAVAGVLHVKNPIELARRVMEKSRHVMLMGAGAEELAMEAGLAMVPNLYFRTDDRRRQLEAEQRGTPVSDLIPAAAGTVGAVAFDKQGNLASATSTGGMTNKRPGRAGDTPVIGAGTYAKNGVAAVSCTGHGEYFIRTVAAYHIVSSVEYRGMSLEQAARELLEQRVAGLGGDGGIIAIDGNGEIVMQFITPGMFRGARDSNGRRETGIGR